jgi:hypothetical protein
VSPRPPPTLGRIILAAREAADLAKHGQPAGRMGEDITTLVELCQVGALFAVPKAWPTDGESRKAG